MVAVTVLPLGNDPNDARHSLPIPVDAGLGVLVRGRHRQDHVDHLCVSPGAAKVAALPDSSGISTGRDGAARED